MCGICGAFDMRGQRLVPENVIEKMLAAIRHRGPDGSRIQVQGGIALGFNRLSFIDLTGGMQPIWNEDRTISMICNGEIFNFKELRDELTAKGHAFRTKTDVEVIIHLYEEYGENFPGYLNGQFAIVLYDEKEQKIILVRDHFGICPLFYTYTDGFLVFGSEIKAILEFPGVQRKLNLKAVDQLMNFPGVVSPDTFFKGIYSMRAGHLLKVRVNEEPRDIEYWDAIYEPEEEDKGEEYYVENLRELIKNAISKRLVADVPIGFYISGGLDSSVVACYIGKYLLNSYYSFSAEIGEGDLDESRFQKIISDYVDSTHYCTRVTEKELWDNIPDVIYHAESGVKESYDVAAYMLSALVQGSPAKAVLTGQGSDEFFYGYAGYMVDLFRGMQKDLINTEEQAVNERLWGDPMFRFERNHPEIRKIHRRLYSSDVSAELESFSAISESPINTERVKGLSTQKRRSYIDFKLRLSDHLLGEHGDRMFFSHSVEGRHPFLDVDLIEFVMKIPDKYKLKGTNEKYILKKAGEGIVPPEVLKRKKFPFQAPGMSAMVKQAFGHEFLKEETLKAQGIFDAAYVQELKKIYSRDDFRLMGAYEIDYLMIVLTVTMLCDRYALTI